MDKTNLPEAGRANAADLQRLASQGVHRALAARMTELTARQAQTVGGGGYMLAYDDWCGNGIIPLPKGTGGGGVGGGVIVIINGKFPEPYRALNLAQVQQRF
jgi:hypothetical protein